MMVVMTVMAAGLHLTDKLSAMPPGCQLHYADPCGW